MFQNAPPGTFANSPFDLSWVSDQVPYCPMLAIFNLVLLSNAHNFTCCRWAIRSRLVGPRVDRTTRRRQLSMSTICRSSGGLIRVLQVSSPTLDLVHHLMPVLGSLGNRLWESHDCASDHVGGLWGCGHHACITVSSPTLVENLCHSVNMILVENLAIFIN